VTIFALLCWRIKVTPLLIKLQVLLCLVQTRRLGGYLTAAIALVLGLATIVPAALRCYAYAEGAGIALLDVNGTDFRSGSGLPWFCCYFLWSLCHPDLGRVKLFDKLLCSCKYTAWGLAACVSCWTALLTRTGFSA